MNLELVDPFSIPDYPETLTGNLRYGHATSVRFNKIGNVLAAGLVNGVVVIWDISTSSVARILTGHTRAVQSVCWSECGRYLLSAARDWKCILWDLLDGSVKYVLRMSAPVWVAELHPSNLNMFVASILDDSPCLVEVKEGIPHFTPLPSNTEGPNSVTDKRGNSKHVTLVCIFHPSGNYIISGTSKGWLHVIEINPIRIKSSNRITSQNIKQLRLSFCKRYLIMNSTDRVIRTINIQDLENFEVEHKFQDVVNRLQWNSCGFSPSGEYVLATTYQMAHAIYVWERGMGSLVKILEGPKEELVDVDWHPVLPCIVAVGLDTGAIYMWSVEQKESWSAFAPDFQELEENIEYDEPEYEFDIHDEKNENKEEVDSAVPVKLFYNGSSSSANKPFTIPLNLNSLDV